MKNLFCIFFLLLFILPGFGQEKVDSLRRVINSTSHADTSRMQAMYELAGYYKYSNPDSTRLLSEQLLELSRTLNDTAEQGRALQMLGIYYSLVDNHEAALKTLYEGLEFNKKAGDSAEIALTLMNIAINYIHLGDQTQALEIFLECVQILRPLDDESYLAPVLHNIGSLYSEEGNYALALDYHQQSIDIYRARDDQFGISRNLGSIGIIYSAQQKYSEALKYFFKNLEIGKQIGDQRGVAFVLNQIANTHVKMGEYDVALEYAKEGLEVSLQIESLAIQGDVFLTQIQAYLGLSQLEKARLTALKTLDIGEEIGDVYLQAEALVSMAELSFLEGEWIQCKDYSSRGMRIAKEARLTDAERDAAELLWKSQNELGQHAEALESYQHYVLMRDSLVREENQRATFAFEYRQKALEDSLVLVQQQADMEISYQQEISQQQYVQRLIIGALVVALLLIGTIIWFNRIKQRVNNQLTQLNEEISRQKEQLEELDELKTHFFANISHELRTPLTIIGGMAEQIEKDPKKNLNKGLEMIRRNNDNLLNLVNQILDLRKLEAGAMHLELVQDDIVFYLRYITESFHSLAESKGIQVHFQSDDSEMFMDFDREKILRIVSNLLSNAIKFTPEKGNVYLTVERTPQATDEKNKTEKDATKSHLRLTIKDTGSGISQDKIGRIFDRFFQADKSDLHQQEGTGIGLALVRELVTLMDGHIKVTSEIDKGTTFIIDLPIHNKAVKAEYSESLREVPLAFSETTDEENISASTIEQQEEVPEQISNILIIDDNKDVVSYLHSLLENDYHIEVAKDGQEGIEMAIEKIPDLIISDVMMPHKNGFEVCDTLKSHAHTSHIPIILLTAKADIDSKLEGLEQGADVYLPKPFNEKELVLNLRNLFEQRRKLQEHYATQNFNTVDTPSSEMPEASNPEDLFLKTATDRILDQLENAEFGNDALARAMRMSESKLNRKIKALTGRTLSIFIRSVRLREGKKMLSTTDLNISEIAYAIGFSDPAYFSRTFAQEFGQAPSAYRN